MKDSFCPEIANTILENTRDSIMVTDQNNRITFVNRAFIEVTGYSAEEVIGQDPNVLKSDRHDAEFYRNMWRTLEDKGQWKGEIWDKRKNGEDYLQFLTINAITDEANKITSYVAVSTDINALHKSEEKLEHISRFDSLTSLPNREQLTHYLEIQLDYSRRNRKLLAVVMLDLDNFKLINDYHGHAVGDRLLMIAAKRLNKLIRSTDMVSRLGGDEFSLILRDLNNIDELNQMTERVLALIAAPFEIDGQKYHSTASIGITLFPFDIADADTLLRHADQAMYKAKANGKNCSHIFDVEQDQLAQTRGELLNRLADGLRQNELVLHYQPKVNLRKGEVVGVEALLRWQHPEEGLLPPGNFLPHIEHHDLIIDIGEWVIRQALQQLIDWDQLGIELSISVNIAARQLLRRDFVDAFQVILEEFPEAPIKRLELEILESAALENTEHVRQVIEACREFGVAFSLDDFGTGYASLSYLRDIPADYLKIDHSFVRNLLDNSSDLTLIEGIIGLATAFQRVVIAEGVETAEQGVLLMRIGCDIVQGFGIAKPMLADEVPAWIDGYQPEPQWVIWADTRWEMSDFPLLVAQYDHINWVRRVLLSLEGEKNDIQRTELTNHHDCRFGHWYYGYGIERYSHITEFAEIEPIHISVHDVGQRLVKACSNGELAIAEKRASELLELKDQILEKLALLQRRIAALPRVAT